MKTIVLLKPHTHENKRRQPGDEIVVNDRDAAWLIKAEVAREKGSTPAASKPALGKDTP